MSPRKRTTPHFATPDLAAPFRTSEDLFRLMVENVKDYAIFMLDVGGRVATWNAGAERIKGYSAKEIIGQHFSRFYPPEDVQARKPEREIYLIAAEQAPPTSQLADQPAPASQASGARGGGGGRGGRMVPGSVTIIVVGK